MSSGSLPCENQGRVPMPAPAPAASTPPPPPMSQPMPGLNTGSCGDSYAQLLAGHLH